MPLAELDPNISGRASRTSNFSNGSKGQYPRQTATKQLDFMGSAGVMGMLRTTTDLGDVASLAVGPARGARPHRLMRPRSGADSRLSTSSCRSHGSRRQSNHRAWPSVSSAGPRRSITSNLTVPAFLDQLPPNSANVAEATALPLPSVSFSEARSYSMTNAVSGPAGFMNHRSLSSLRGIEPLQRPRSPYRYPTRLKRPGYRPSSPALSDVTGARATRTHHPVLASRLRQADSQLNTLHTQQTSQCPAPRNNSAPYVPQPAVQNHPSLRMGGRCARTASLAPSVHVSSTSIASSHASAPTAQTSSNPPPSTPRTPIDPLLGQAPAVPVVPPVSAAIQPGQSSGAFYYDYSEHFQRKQPANFNNNEYEETRTSSLLADVVRSIESPLDQHVVHHDSTSSSNHLFEYKGAQDDYLPSSDLPELPATPVAKRITREMILSAISPTSDDSDAGDMSTPKPVALKTFGELEEPITNAELEEPTTNAELLPSPVPITNNEDFRRSAATSAASAAGTQLSLSTTMKDFALRYSMPGSMPPSSSSLHSNLELVDIEQDQEQVPGATDGAHSPSFSEVQDLPIAMPTPVENPSVARLMSRANMGRAQASFDPSSSVKDSPTSYSVPLDPVEWQLMDANSAFASSTSSSKQVSMLPVPFRGSLVEPPASSTSHLQTPQPMTTASTLEGLISPCASPEMTGSGPQAPISPPCTQGLPQSATPDARNSISTTHLSTLWAFEHTPATGPTAPAYNEQVEAYKNICTPTRASDVRSSLLRPASALPGITEAPSVESSRADLRDSTYRFPLPSFSIPQVPADMIRRSVDGSSKRDIIRDSVFRAETRSLYDIRAIPSLNFSQINLIAKLNDALEQRRRSSFDAFPHLFEASAASCRDSGIIREKYRSLFSSLDGSENLVDVNEKTMNVEEQSANEERDAKQPNLDHPYVFSTLRPLSPTELIDEVNRISIPSIAALTHRLSELLPSLKRYYNDEGPYPIEDPVESTINEIRRLGNITPPSESVVKELTTDGTVENPRSLDAIGSATERNCSAAKELRSETPRRSASHPGHVLVTPLAELDAPSPAGLRTRSLSDSGVDRQAITLRVPDTPFDRRRSLSANSPAESRPWNLEASYPWANSVPVIDICLPPPTLRRDTIKQQPSKLRLRLSDDSDNADGTSGRVPTSPFTPQDSGDTTQSTQDTFSSANKRKTSRRSILGSISRKIGFVGQPGLPIDNFGFPGRQRTLQGDERAVDPGDRYPTSGLSPPSAFNIEEVRSFFSDDSSHVEQRPPGGSFRKRLTQLKAKLPPAACAQSALEHRDPVGDGNDSFFAGSPRSASRDSICGYPDGTAGMSRAEFIRRKIGHHLRSVWYRGAEIFRSISVRKKAPAEVATTEPRRRLSELENTNQREWCEPAESVAPSSIQG